MNLRRSFAAGTALFAVAGATVAAQPAAAAPSRVDLGGTKVSVDWKPCPTYSDEVLAAMMPPTEIPKFKQLWSRTECGTVKVPLDYRKPHGRTITVAITRLKATDQKQRLGSLALNPGGPGGSGYLMPHVFAMRPDTAKLNERYDLIGFDPRGVGYSSKVNCQRGGGEGPPPGDVTEAEARRVYDATVAANQACAATDPAFLSQVTTGNIARDLDRVRAGLGERKLNYYGVSWGSWLGPVYRSLFPRNAGRMWVDSVAPTDPRLDTFTALRAMATDRNFSRMAEWMARFDSTYGFGTTGAEVEAAIAELRADFQANPRQFTDIDFPITGFEISLSAEQPSPVWPLAARVLADLRDATGPTAPESLKQAIGEPGPPPPPGMPEQFNPTAGAAVFCNGDGGSRDFESEWAAYQQRVRDYPVTGVMSSFTPPCAGWPFPVERIRLRDSGSPLVLSGHRWESVSVYEWTAEMQGAVGGLAFTVEDDVHGSAPDVPECFEQILSFFETGRVGARGCEGVPMPTGPDDGPGADAASTSTAFGPAPSSAAGDGYLGRRID
jgi:pimeloyl-ACP methyl ester carboxylesterase